MKIATTATTPRPPDNGSDDDNSNGGSGETPSGSVTAPNPLRWKALAVLSLAQFLIILDTSIVGVALPAIQEQFGFSQAGLQWIFNAYVIAFGALLLLGGKLSDVYGRYRLFVAGFAVLTGASILAGLAPAGEVLIASRALQGLGAALIAPSALSILMGLFTVEPERRRAMGFWGASAPAGGTAGVFLGGVISAWLDWPWIFLINVPVGVAVLALAYFVFPRDGGDGGGSSRTGAKGGAGKRARGRIVDYPGAASITGALVVFVYALVTGNDAGWLSPQTLLLLAGGSLLSALFLAIEKRQAEPLIPLRIFGARNLLSANIVMALLGAAWIPAWFFLNLYLQQTLGYGPLESGLALLPMTVTIMALMVGATSKIAGRLGMKRSLVAGLALLAAGLVLFSRAPPASEGGGFVTHVLPASVVAAAGMSLAYIPALTLAVAHARKEDAGVASGLVNTSYQVGSAVGLAAIVALAAVWTESLLGGGAGIEAALNGGFRAAFVGAAAAAAAAGATAALLFIDRAKMGRRVWKKREE